MMDPIILFFILGITLGVLKSEVRLPSQIYDAITIVLLLSIGLKGGIELAKQPFNSLIIQITVIVAVGFLLPFIAYPVLKFFGKFKKKMLPVLRPITDL